MIRPTPRWKSLAVRVITILALVLLVLLVMHWRRWSAAEQDLADAVAETDISDPGW